MTDKNSNKPAGENKQKASSSNASPTPSQATKPEAAAKPETLAKPDSKPATAKPASTSRRKKSSNYLELFLFITVVAFIVATVYYVEKQLKEQATQQRYALDQRSKNLEARIQELENTQAQSQQQLGNINDKQKNLNDAFTSLLKTRRHLRNDWLLAEAEYLLKLASQRLQLAADIGSALAAMQTADERLYDTADPAVIPLRKQLAEDINRLKAVAMPDISGLSLTLSALSKAVDELPLLASQLEDKAMEVSAADAVSKEQKQLESWQQLPAMIWQDMKKLLDIREHHGRVKPLLTPSQHFFLKQNLVLKLEQAQLALLDHNKAVYHQRLQTAMDWINRYFKTDDSATQNMLTQLQELAVIDIQPELPDISASYHALKDFQEKQADASRLKNNNGNEEQP